MYSNAILSLFVLQDILLTDVLIVLVDWSGNQLGGVRLQSALYIYNPQISVRRIVTIPRSNKHKTCIISCGYRGNIISLLFRLGSAIRMYGFLNEWRYSRQQLCIIPLILSQLAKCVDYINRQRALSDCITIIRFNWILIWWLDYFKKCAQIWIFKWFVKACFYSYILRVGSVNSGALPVPVRCINVTTL